MAWLTLADGAGAIEYGHQVTGQYCGSGVNNLYNGTFFWQHGTTAGVDAHNTASFYRFHLNDPIVFNTGLKLTWACGDTTESSFTGNPVVWTTVSILYATTTQPSTPSCKAQALSR